MKYSNKKILVTAPFPSILGEIAKIDVDILTKNQWVVRILNSHRRFPLRLTLLLDLLRDESEIICVHSSGYYDDITLLFAIFVGKLENKKVISIHHCGSMEIFLKKFWFIVKPLFIRCHQILAVSDFVKREILKYIPQTERKIRVLYNPIKIPLYNQENNLPKKERIALTVGAVSRWYTLRKGLKTFVEAAKFLPDVKFVLVGAHIDSAIESLKAIAPKNVLFTGFVTDSELTDWYNKSAVYCQLSKSESFGVAVAEAMSHYCVPVVTYSTSLPEVVGNCGFYVPYESSKKTAEAIKKALASPEKGKMARERIIKLFSLEQREKQLISIINELLVKSEK